MCHSPIAHLCLNRRISYCTLVLFTLHLVFYLPHVQLCRSSATFHTDWYTAVALISPTVTAVIRSLWFLFWYIAFQAFSDSPLRMMAIRLEWITTVSFLPSPSHKVPSLSPLISVDNKTSHLFSFVCLRLVSNGCYSFISVTGLAGSMLLSVLIRSFFCLVSSFFAFRISSPSVPLVVAQIFLLLLPSCTEAQAWGELSSTLSPTDINCVSVGVAVKNTGCRDEEGPRHTICFLRCVGWLAPRALLSREVMGTPSIRLDPTPFPWSSHAFAHSRSVRTRLCFGFRQETAHATSNFMATVWANVQVKITGTGVLTF